MLFKLLTNAAADFTSPRTDPYLSNSWGMSPQYLADKGYSGAQAEFVIDKQLPYLRKLVQELLDRRQGNPRPNVTAYQQARLDALGIDVELLASRGYSPGDFADARAIGGTQNSVASSTKSKVCVSVTLEQRLFVDATRGLGRLARTERAQSCPPTSLRPGKPNPRIRLRHERSFARSYGSTELTSSLLKRAI